MPTPDFTGMDMVPPDPDQDDSKLAAPSSGESAPDLNGLLGALLGGAGAGQPATAGSPGDLGGMDLGSLLGALGGGGPLTGSADETAGAAGAGMDMGGLLGALLGGGSSTGGLDLGSLLGGLLGGGAGAGGGADVDVDAISSQAGVAPSIIQAAIPLVIGALVQGKARRSSGVSPDGSAMDPAMADLPNRLSGLTGISQPQALTVIQTILQFLGILPATSKAKRRRKPSSSSNSASAKPKRKPSSASSSSSKPKRKPPSSAGAKPKRKPSSGKRKSTEI